MFYILLICIFICGLLFIFDKEITPSEFFIMCVSSCTICLILWLFTLFPYPNDIMFHSGRLKKVEYRPYFVERYRQPHTICHSCGKGCTSCHTYYTTEYAKHPDKWVAYDSLGQSEEISKTFFNTVAKDFGNNVIQSHPNRCTHGGVPHKGDSSLYTVNNETNTYNYPTTVTTKWHNPVKDNSTLFNTKKDKKEFVKYPIRQTWFVNNRLLTKDTDIPIKTWDILNTKVYEKLGVNVVLLHATKSDVEQIRDTWNKGKKNDIIITYVGDYNKPDLVKVFGWYKSEMLSTMLETYILDNGISLKSLPGLQHRILSYYAPFDFTQFKYLKQPPPLWLIILCIIANIISIGVSYTCLRDNYDNRY